MAAGNNIRCYGELVSDDRLAALAEKNRDKSCGVCFQIVWKKPTAEQCFGILPACQHVFCVTCIRQWRSNKNLDKNVVRGCPECRTKSNFIIPSRYWVDGREEKEQLINNFRAALARKPCRYFDGGRGECPFRRSCFYSHALPGPTDSIDYTQFWMNYIRDNLHSWNGETKDAYFRLFVDLDGYRHSG